jgi:predicted DNA-binding transcriptional regulator AlpA
MTEACLRTPEASKFLGIAESTLEKMRVTGTGPVFIRIGTRTVAYRKQDLDAFLAARVCQSTLDRPMAAA